MLLVLPLAAALHGNRGAKHCDLEWQSGSKPSPSLCKAAVSALDTDGALQLGRRERRVLAHCGELVRARAPWISFSRHFPPLLAAGGAPYLMAMS